MRKALFVCAAIGCLAGFFFDAPNQRFFVSLIGALLPFPVCYFALWAIRRNWLQFSLRDLLLAIAFYSIGLSEERERGKGISPISGPILDLSPFFSPLPWLL